MPHLRDDSFYVTVDDGEYVTHNGLDTTGWEGLNLDSYDLEVGDHALTTAYR